MYLLVLSLLHLAFSQTLDPCSSSLPCPSSHTCYSIIGPSILTPCDTSCFCFPPLPDPCNSTSVCPPSEQCATVPAMEVDLCVSSLAAAYLPVTPLAPLKTPDNQGLTLEPCRDKCASPRKCVSAKSGALALLSQGDTGTPCSEEDNKCFCLGEKLDQCKQNSDCTKGEVCAEIEGSEGSFCASQTAVQYAVGITEKGDDSDPGLPNSIPGIPTVTPPPSVSTPEPNASPVDSPPPTPSSSPDDGNQSEQNVSPSEEPNNEGGENGGVTRVGCVDVALLRGIQREHLVFEKDRLARVFCDAKDSCATAGHIVMWGGKAMMMRSYCEKVGCREEIRWVNSPKFSKKGRVASRSHGLEFTVFAAKYETWVEERFLTTLVHMGV